MAEKPNPGSYEARKRGCICPVIDNNHGVGSGERDDRGKPLFWIADACPMHGLPLPAETIEGSHGNH